MRDDITIKAILESGSNAADKDDKTNRVDLLAQDQFDRNIIIEVQYEDEGDYFHRIAFGASKALVESIEAGQEYGAIRRVISISILHFDLGQGLDYVYTGRNEFRGMHHNDLLNLSELQKESYKCLQVSDIFPEYFLLKVNNFNNVARDGLDQWIYFLKTGNIKRGASGKGLDEAKKVLDVLKLSKAERAAYEAYIKVRRIAVGVAQSTILRAERAETALAEERRQKDEAQQREEEERRQKDEAFRQREEERRLKDEAQQREEEERRQKNEAFRQREEERRLKDEAQQREEEERRLKDEAFRQREQILAIALKALIAQGMSESQARKTLGIVI